jgi:hypothetical protein
VQHGGSSSALVILSVAKNLSRYDEILRYAQNDKLLGYFCRAALALCGRRVGSAQKFPVPPKAAQKTNDKTTKQPKFQTAKPQNYQTATNGIGQHESPR